MTEWQCLAFRAAVRFWQLGVFGLCFLRDEMGCDEMECAMFVQGKGSWLEER